VAEGIVPGGGVTLVDLSKKLAVEPTKVASSEEAGHLVLKRALVQPFRELMRNAGLNPDEKLPLVLASKGGQGFDVNSADALVDLKQKGIVDPAKVTREAVQNAVSIAGTAMTMGSLIVELPEEKPAAGGGGMPGGMGGMDY
jgi:chaperonin GroEL